MVTNEYDVTSAGKPYETDCTESLRLEDSMYSNAVQYSPVLYSDFTQQEGSSWIQLLMSTGCDLSHLLTSTLLLLQLRVCRRPGADIDMRFNTGC